MTRHKHQHTPGPWTRGGETSDGWYLYAGETPIARTIASVDELEERANARLIAAAPELLEACKVALERLSLQGAIDADEETELLEAAIAKAEGGKGA